MKHLHCTLMICCIKFPLSPPRVVFFLLCLLTSLQRLLCKQTWNVNTTLHTHKTHIQHFRTIWEVFGIMLCQLLQQWMLRLMKCAMTSSNRKAGKDSSPVHHTNPFTDVPRWSTPGSQWVTVLFEKTSLWPNLCYGFKTAQYNKAESVVSSPVDSVSYFVALG